MFNVIFMGAGLYADKKCCQANFYRRDERFYSVIAGLVGALSVQKKA